MGFLLALYIYMICAFLMYKLTPPLEYAELYFLINTIGWCPYNNTCNIINAVEPI